jgi:8-oxo-dGTP diphosphatase
MSLNLEHRNKKVNNIHEGKWSGLGGKFAAGKHLRNMLFERSKNPALWIRHPKLHGLLMVPKFKGND